MMKSALKSTAVALALVGACTAANATTKALGASAPGAPLPFSGFAPVGAFTDIFTFTIPENSGSGYSVVNFPLTLPSGTFNTIFSSLALYSDTDDIAFNGGETLLTSSSSGGGAMSLTWGPTVGGNMILQVSGATNGTSGGLYSGAISVTAVPEPSTWAMLGLGAGMIGFALRRKTR